MVRDCCGRAAGWTSCHNSVLLFNIRTPGRKAAEESVERSEIRTDSEGAELFFTAGKVSFEVER